jgi:TetR/AcrR family fatty acid metabolism transcriptional regulator
MAGSRQRRTVQRMPAEKRVSDIMSAARAVLAERGAHESFISEVAERAGVVEGSIYRFFSSKRDLIEKVAELWYEEMLADYSANLEGVRGTRNRLRFIIHHHLSIIKKEPALARMVFQEFRPAKNYRSTRLFALNQTYTQRIVEIVKAAISDGEFRGDFSPALVRDMIFGGIEHRVWAFLRNEGDFNVSQTANAVTDFVCRALRAADAEPADRVTAALSRIEAVADRLEGLGAAEAPAVSDARRKPELKS